MAKKQKKMEMNRRDLFKMLLGGSASLVAFSSGLGIKSDEAKANGVPSLAYGNPTFPLSDADFTDLERVDVDGKVAVITGASTGIGRAVANDLAARGFTVIGTSRRPQDFPAPNNFELWKLDLTIPGSIDSFAKRVRKEFSHINLLVLNAGRYFIGRYADADINKVQETFETNMNGHQRLYQLLEPAFPASENDYARVFFTSSESDTMYLMDLQNISIPGFENQLPRFVGDFAYPYCVSKSGIARAAHLLYGRLRNMGSNIQVTVFYPLVFINTDIAKDTIFGSDPNDLEISSQAQLLKFFIEHGTDPSVMGKAYGQMARLQDPFLTSYVFNKDPVPGTYEWLVNQLWPVMVIQEEDRTVRSVRP